LQIVNSELKAPFGSEKQRNIDVKCNTETMIRTIGFALVRKDERCDYKRWARSNLAFDSRFWSQWDRYWVIL